MRQHQERVRAFLQSQEKITWKIHEPCRLDNQGILTLAKSAATHKNFEDIATFIPAAGAASRFTAPLSELLQSYRESPKQFAQSAKGFIRKYAKIKLPDELVQFLEKASQEEIFLEDIETLYALIALPKAFFPCGRANQTFLEYKLEENRAIGTFGSQVFVASPDHSSEFQRILQKNDVQGPVAVFEQADDLCTYRFDQNAEVILEANGHPSLVAGGHGMLSRLFPEVKEQFPTISSLFIHNIDNLTSSSEDKREETRNLLRNYQSLLEAIQTIRIELQHKNILAADKQAQGALLTLGIEFKTSAEQEEANLVYLQKEIFHTPDDILPKRHGLEDQTFHQRLLEAYQRPLSMVGQVPNSGNDRGGIPVWAKLGGKTRKLCLEGPHISPDDMILWFEEKKLVSHFNPVFLVTEIPQSADYYLNAANDLWVIAEKSYLGRPAYYCESVLYEMVANSALANTVFFEISRELFRPVKSLDDLLIRP